MSTTKDGRELCGWCLPPSGKRRTANSAWEQQNIHGEWMRLCNRCANRRLDNPYNALLNLRKVIADVR